MSASGWKQEAKYDFPSVPAEAPKLGLRGSEDPIFWVQKSTRRGASPSLWTQEETAFHQTPGVLPILPAGGARRCRRPRGGKAGCTEVGAHAERLLPCILRRERPGLRDTGVSAAKGGWWPGPRLDRYSLSRRPEASSGAAWEQVSDAGKKRVPARFL